MTSFARKFKRKKKIETLKTFKKTMKTFKKMIMCSSCGRVPTQGENIDNWGFEQRSDRISLTCEECRGNAQNE